MREPASFLFLVSRRMIDGRIDGERGANKNRQLRGQRQRM